MGKINISSVLFGHAKEEILSWKPQFKKLLAKYKNYPCELLDLSGSLESDIRCPYLVVKRYLEFLDRLGEAGDTIYVDNVIRFVLSAGIVPPDVLDKKVESTIMPIAFVSKESCLDHVGFSEDLSEIDWELVSKLIRKVSSLSYLYPPGEPIKDIVELTEHPVKFIGDIYNQLMWLQYYREIFGEVCRKGRKVYFAVAPQPPREIVLNNEIMSKIDMNLPNVNIMKLNKLLSHGLNIMYGNLGGAEVKELDEVQSLVDYFTTGYSVSITADSLNFILDPSGESYRVSFDGTYSLSQLIEKFEDTIQGIQNKAVGALSELSERLDIAILSDSGNVTLYDGLYTYEVFLSDFVKAITGELDIQKAFQNFIEKKFRIGSKKKLLNRLFLEKGMPGVPSNIRDDVIDSITTLEFRFGKPVIDRAPRTYNSPRDIVYWYGRVLHKVRHTVSEQNLHIVKLSANQIISLINDNKLRTRLLSRLPGMVIIELYIKLPMIEREERRWYFTSKWYRVHFAGMPPFSKVIIDRAVPEVSSVPAMKKEDISLRAAAGSGYSINLSKLNSVIDKISSYFSEASSVVKQVQDLSVLVKLGMKNSGNLLYSGTDDVILVIHQ